MKKVFFQFATFFLITGIYLFVGGIFSQAHASLRDGAFTLNGPVGYNAYNMGYQFTPTASGTVTQLWCLGSGGSTSTVTVWNTAGTALGSASITCNTGTWVGSGAVSIPLTSGTSYVVTQYGSSAYYEFNLALPFTANNITITNGAYNTGGYLYPNSFPAGYIYGMPDITYSATPPCPCAATTTTGAVNYNSIGVNGTVNPASSNTMYFGVRYGAAPTYNASTLCSNLPNIYGWWTGYALNTTSPVTLTAYNLSPNTTYYLCIIGWNYSTNIYYSSTTTVGATTPIPPAPTISAYPAHTIDSNSAVLPAGINAYGLASTGYFRWGQSPTYTTASACSTLPNVTTNGSAGASNNSFYPLSVQITTFTANSTYVFCYQATTTSGTGYSAVTSFTTAATATTGCQLFPGSAFASSTDSSTVLSYIGSSKFQGARIYQATVNGWTSANFHTAVDGKGTTIILIKATNNKVFGFYGPQSWNSTGSWTAGAGAFLFSLSDGYKLNQINYADYQFLGYGAYSPYIGSGPDLGLSSSPLSGTWSNNGGNAYEAPSTKGAFTYISGASSFTPSEIEVWQLSVCTTPPPPPPTPVSVACPAQQMTKTVATSAVQSTLGPAATGTLSSPNSATTPDSIYAIANVNGAGTYAPGIMATGFGFTIPTGAIITGINAFAGYYTPGVSTASTGMGSALTKTGTAVAGTTFGEAYLNHSSIAYYNLTTGGVVSVSNLWGTTWTPADINAATFGIGYASASSNAAGSVGFYVDSFQITVCYSQGPSLTNTSVTVFSPTTATLPGTVNANGTSTTAWFRYNTTNAPGNTCNGIDTTWTGSTRAPATGGTVYADSTSHPYSQDITGLLAGTTYYFCAIAQDANNNWGTNSSAPFSFTTPLPLFCTPSSQPAGTGAPGVTVNASGGNGLNYVWSAPGGSPASASGASTSFSTQYATGGSYRISVVSAGLSASCTVNVSAGAMGNNTCSNKLGIYCYVVSALRDSYILWAQLENTKDQDTTSCLDQSPPDNTGKWNYCQRSE